MGKKRNQRKAKQSHQAVQPAPMLFKRSVTLTDATELFSSSVLGSGFGQFQVTANGFRLPTSANYRVPQDRIWTQYAAMFELYQVKQVHAKFIPYKWEYPGGVGAVQTTGYPTWSIIDPESTLPSLSLPGSYYSYGNCKDTRPYDEHHRSMRSYTDLGISKQESLILKTNGSAASRNQYTDPATIGILARAPTQASGVPIGLIVFTVCYEFSGQRAPNVAVPRPISDGIAISETDAVVDVGQPQARAPLKKLTALEAEAFKRFLDEAKE